MLEREKITQWGEQMESKFHYKCQEVSHLKNLVFVFDQPFGTCFVTIYKILTNNLVCFQSLRIVFVVVMMKKNDCEIPAESLYD